MLFKSTGTKTGRLVSLLPPLLLILAACATGAIREKLLTMPQIDGANYVGQDTCLECHEDMTESFSHNVHGRLADFEMMGAEKGCESCTVPAACTLMVMETPTEFSVQPNWLLKKLALSVRSATPMAT